MVMVCIGKRPRGNVQVDRLARIRTDVVRELRELLQGTSESKLLYSIFEWYKDEIICEMGVKMDNAL